MRWVVAFVIGLFFAGSASGEVLERDVTDLHHSISDFLGHAPASPGVLRFTEGLTKAEIGRVAARHFDELKYCYEAFSSRGDVFDGQGELVFTIDGEGDVSAATVVSALHNASVEDCLRSNVLRWKFPAPRGGVVEVHQPLAFVSDTMRFPSAPLLHPAIRQDLAKCFQWRERPDRVVFGIRVRSPGDVVQFRVAEPTWLPPHVVDCFRASVEKWDFPADFPRDGSEVEIPIAFAISSETKVEFPLAEPFLKSELTACYDEAADELERFGPDLTLSVHVDASGEVDDAAVLQSSSPFPAFEQCLLDAVRHWHANDESLRGGQMLFRLNFWPR